MADEQAAAQQLVRAAHEGDLSKAIALLPMESRPMESQYVLAQMALTDGDEKVLKTYAEPLLRKLDRLLLRMDGGDETSTASLPDLRIDVLQRLDLGLYGAPHSQVSFAVATPLASSAVPGEQWFVADLAGVAGALFLAWLSTGALVLCHRMSQRSLRLRAWLGIA